MSRSAESAGRIMIIRIINLNDSSIIVNILETELVIDFLVRKLEHSRLPRRINRSKIFSRRIKAQALHINLSTHNIALRDQMYWMTQLHTSLGIYHRDGTIFKAHCKYMMPIVYSCQHRITTL